MPDMWSKVAVGWESNADFVDEHLAAATRILLDFAGIDESDDVLDLACGSGGAGMVAASRVGPSGSVMLADNAPGMVAAAARRSAELDYVSTLLCGQDKVTVPDETFDAVINRHGLMFATDRTATVKEAVRVLKPGGRYAVMTWGPRADNPWLGLILDAVGDEFNVPFPPAGVLGPFSLDDPDVLEEALEKGGASEVRVETVASPMSVESLDAWWGLVPQLAGPLAIALEGMEPNVRDSIRERAIRSGSSVEGNPSDAIVMNGSVLIASGLRA